MARDLEHPITPAGAAAGESLLALARADTEPARERLRALAPEIVAAGLHDLPAKQRLELVERVEEIVPLLAETELISTIREVGIADAGWLVEFASGEQRVAAIDLDCWRDRRFSPSRFCEWLGAMIEAGPETLAAAFAELDLEVWLLTLKQMADFSGGRCGGRGGR